MAHTLRTNQIPAAFLKGVALAAQIYPHAALRTMSDIDLWIPPNRLAEGVRVLCDSGFRIPERYALGFPNHGPFTTATLEPTGGPTWVCVELHGLPYSLSTLPSARIDAMWSERITLADPPIDVLDAPDQLTHLCLHLSRHHSFVRGLPTLVDLTLAIRHWSGSIQWLDWTERIREDEASASVWTVMRLTKDLMHAPVPEDALDRLAPGDPRTLVEEAEEQLWEGERDLPGALERLFGGGGGETGWFRRRLVGRPWAVATGEAPTASRWARAKGTASLMLRDVRQKSGEYMALFTRGDVISRAFWRRVRTARKRGRVLRRLERMDRQTPGFDQDDPVSPPRIDPGGAEAREYHSGHSD
jgi:hypothetical protein